MKRLIFVVAFYILAGTFSNAQTNVGPLPKPAFEARTVAIVNNTHNDAVSEGAVEALKRWGRLTIVDDSDTADITLTFDKKSEHEGTSTQKTGEDGKPDSSYSMSFSSSIKMKALLRGNNSSFYSTSTGESKKKAGLACVLSLQKTFLEAPR